MEIYVDDAFLLLDFLQSDECLGLVDFGVALIG